jgi:hypothetical protein
VDESQESSPLEALIQPQLEGHFGRDRGFSVAEVISYATSPSQELNVSSAGNAPVAANRAGSRRARTNNQQNPIGQVPCATRPAVAKRSHLDLNQDVAIIPVVVMQNATGTKSDGKCGQRRRHGRGANRPTILFSMFYEE